MTHNVTDWEPIFTELCVQYAEIDPEANMDKGGYVVLVVPQALYLELCKVANGHAPAEMFAQRLANTIVWCNAYGEPVIEAKSPTAALKKELRSMTTRVTRWLPFTRHG